ncbi:MAG: Chorismate dehydratase [Turneriella sp.]|nr:Chorismate dehydratase [Turneriella sp.]
MSALRLGVVNFLNAYPLWGSLENDARVTLVPDIPSRLVTFLEEGRVDAALISSIEFFRLGKPFTYHPHVCVGAAKKVESIRFFVEDSTLSFQEVLSKIRVIYTDAASRSSVAQLRVILKKLKSDLSLHEVNQAEEKIPLLGTGEALLAIGDTALRHRTRPSYDLQSIYYSLFNRGFVYAIWVYREELKPRLDTLLEEAYVNYTQNGIALRRAAKRRFGFSADFTEEYLTRIIQHQLTKERREDLVFFARECGFSDITKNI